MNLREKLERNLKGANTATLDAVGKRLWKLPADRAVVAVDLGVGLASISVRLGLEGLKVAPDVARLVPTDDFRLWGEIARRLAATSPEVAMEFFAVSSASLEELPAERRAVLLQLVGRQSALSSRIALDTFKFAPVFVKRVGDSRLALELLTIALELARHSVKHSWELLQAAPDVVDHLNAKGWSRLVHRAFSLASAFAQRSGGAAADFFARLPKTLRDGTEPVIEQLLDETLIYLDRSGGVALQYFVAGGLVLQIAGPQSFVKWSDLSRRVALQGNAASYHFLKFSPSVMAELSKREREYERSLVLEVLSIVQALAEAHPLAAIECFRAAPRALQTASLRQFAHWAERGVELTKGNQRRVQAYFGLESRGSQESLREADGGLPLDSVSNMLRLYVEALTGKELKIATVHEIPTETTIGDGTTIFLPTVVAQFEDSDDNFRLYKVLAAHGAGQIEFGTYERSTDELRAAFLAIEERFRSKRVSERKTRPAMPRDLGYGSLFALFPDPVLARRLFATIENGRIDSRLRLKYRGIRRDLDFVRDRLFHSRPPAESLPLDEAPFEILLRVALGAAVGADTQRLFGVLVDAVEGLFARHVFGREAGLSDSFLATADAYELFTSALVQGDLEAQTGESPQEEETEGDAAPSKPDPDAPRRSQDRKDAMPSGQVAHWSQRTETDLSDELDSLATQTNADASEQELEPGDIAVDYDEWDRELGDYRAGWCRVIERRGSRGTRSFVDLVRSRYSGAISSIRYQFQLMRPENLRRIRGELDGEEFDLQAVIDHAIDRRATGKSTDRLYIRTLRRQRDVAVAFLLDMSSSTARSISRYPNQPYSHPGRRIIDIEKEGLVLMSEALEAVGDLYAMHGFSSEGRRNVKFLVFKEFNEAYSADVEKRLGGISYLNNTRLGAAIRHSAAKLAAQEQRTKLLVVLSDGRPYDHDYGDSRYAREDTKMALRQAQRAGITPFCITIDRESEDQLKDLYGEVGYTIIDDVLSLPERMPAIYRRLTT
jgi:nitric oxide reductase NorD protein